MINKISFNVGETIGELSPHMFGANLEHIGEAIYKNGVWARQLKIESFVALISLPGIQESNMTI